MARFTIEGDRPNRTANEEQYRRLESGDILYFPRTPFELTAEERNSSFRSGRATPLPQEHQLSPRRGPAQGGRSERPRRMGADASDDAGLLDPRHRLHVFVPVAVSRTTGKSTSPASGSIEEAGRKVALRSRNDLIHVDSFPSRPSHGDRLLRIFTNIHPDRSRIWVTSDPFEQLAWQYAGKAGLPHPPGGLAKLRSKALRRSRRSACRSSIGPLTTSSCSGSTTT